MAQTEILTEPGRFDRQYWRDIWNYRELFYFLACDSSRPDGQPRRCLDTLRAGREFGFKAGTGFEEGLKKTVERYRWEVVEKQAETGL